MSSTSAHRSQVQAVAIPVPQRLVRRHSGPGRIRHSPRHRAEPYDLDPKRRHKRRPHRRQQEDACDIPAVSFVFTPLALPSPTGLMANAMTALCLSPEHCPITSHSLPDCPPTPHNTTSYLMELAAQEKAFRSNRRADQEDFLYFDDFAMDELDALSTSPSSN